MYLFDSDILIDFLHQKDPGFSLVKSLLSESISISIITWIEISYGTEKAKLLKRKNEWKNFLEDFNIKIYNVDNLVAEKYVDVKTTLDKKGELLPDFDLLITASALAYNLILVTRNLKHFQRINNLKIYEPRLN